jgi:cytoskeletal protein CcmA (bactofilin family)
MSALPETATTDAKPGSSRPPGRSVLASDLRIVGDISAEGTIELMGEVEGSVKSKSLIVSNEGSMSGTVSADTVELKGRMQGAIGCNTLTLRSAAQVQADVVYSTLAIEAGAQIDGSFKKPKA